MTKVRKAVFPVAGFGTRFLSATNAMPKKLLPVVEDHFDVNAELEVTLIQRDEAVHTAMVHEILSRGGRIEMGDAGRL